MRFKGAASAILISLLIAAAQAPTATTYEYMTRARSGAGFGFSLAYELLPYSEVVPEGLSPDGDWIRIRYANVPAWVQRETVILPPDLNLPTLDDVPPAPELPAENCVTLIGDSVPYGSVVYIIPELGFAILRTPPISIALQEALTKRGLGYLEVHDRSASAAFLSEHGKNPYSETEEYTALLEDRCRVTVVMPWINDLSVERENAPDAHVSDLVTLTETLNAVNPHSRIFVLGFYYGQPSEFANQHAPGYYDDNITAFNDALFAACESGGQLAAFENVTCMETAPLFEGLDNRHVALGATHDELTAILYEPIPPDVQPLFDAYWRNHPAGEVYGDGVHLSELGKTILAQALVDEFLAVNPDL